MQRDEQQHRVTVERLRLLASRARKVYRARDDLDYIFQILNMFEKDVPMIRQHLLANIPQDQQPGVMDKDQLNQEAARIRNMVV